jgi:hypothetical protein
MVRADDMKIRATLICVATLLASLPALAQFQAPPPALLHIDARPARTVPQGEVLLRIGLGYEDDVIPAPLLGGPRGDLWSVPKLQVGVPIGPRADLDVEVPLVMHLEIGGDPRDLGTDGHAWEPGGSETEAGDLRIATRVLFRQEPERGPAVGMRFGLKVPSASDETGLGTDEADVFAELLLSQPVGRGTMHLNVGLAILGDPTENSSQEDVVTYALAWEVRPGARTAWFVEASGIWNPSSSSRGEEGVVRTGISREVGMGRGAWEGTLLAGYEDASPDWGVTFARLIRFGRR